MSTQFKAETRMIKRFLLVPILTFLACASSGGRTDGLYAVEDREFVPVYRPVEPSQFASGVKVTPGHAIYAEVLPETVMVRLYNLSEGSLEVDWSRSVLVLNGDSHPALLVDEGFDCRHPDQSPTRTVIPPRSHFHGYVVAADRIAWHQFSQEVNELSYPPGYWGATALVRLLNPDRPELHGGYCERKDFFLLTRRGRYDGQTQRHDLALQMGSRLSLHLEMTRNGASETERLDYSLLRVAAKKDWRPCLKEESLQMMTDRLLGGENMDTIIQQMTLGECGYE